MRMAMVHDFGGFFAYAVEQLSGACTVPDDERVCHYEVAGRPVRIVFDSRHTAEAVTPAIGHLACARPGREDISIYCFDRSAGAVDLSRFAWVDRIDPARQAMPPYLYRDERFKVFFSQSGVFSLYDREKNTALCCLDGKRALPFYELCTPFKYIFHMSMCAQERQLVLGAAVGDTRGAVLLVGGTHAGKSTAAIACLDAGFEYIGDDYCMVHDEPLPYVSSVYSSALLTCDALSRFPSLQPALAMVDRASDRTVYFLTRIFPGRTIKGARLRAILTARISGRCDTALTPVSAAETLKALAPATLAQLPFYAQRSLHAIGSVVKKVPCYTIELGTELSRIPPKIAELLSQGA